MVLSVLDRTCMKFVRGAFGDCQSPSPTSIMESKKVMNKSRLNVLTAAQIVVISKVYHAEISNLVTERSSRLFGHQEGLLGL
jgi:hypothetical protein